jgi:predicted XRE-type DNA-binding protein
MGRPRLSEKIDAGHQNAPARHRAHPRPHPLHSQPAALEDEIELVHGTGNIFADFGRPDAERKWLKTIVAAEIVKSLNERKLTVRQGAKLAGCDPADLQRIRNADLSRFTLDRLVKIVTALGRKVELVFSDR